MAKDDQNFHVVSLLNKVIATLSLATLTALGVYVNLNRTVVANVATHGYRVVSLDTLYCNVACTVGRLEKFFLLVLSVNHIPCLSYVGHTISW